MQLFSTEDSTETTDNVMWHSGDTDFYKQDLQSNQFKTKYTTVLITDLGKLKFLMVVWS